MGTINFVEKWFKKAADLKAEEAQEQANREKTKIKKEQEDKMTKEEEEKAVRQLLLEIDQTVEKIKLLVNQAISIGIPFSGPVIQYLSIDQADYEKVPRLLSHTGGHVTGSWDSMGYQINYYSKFVMWVLPPEEKTLGENHTAYIGVTRLTNGELIKMETEYGKGYRKYFFSQYNEEVEEKFGEFVAKYINDHKITI